MNVLTVGYSEEVKDTTSRPRPQPRTSLTRQRGTRLKSNSKAFTCN